MHNFKGLAAVIAAGGHGSFRPGVSKLVEEVGGKPAICHTVETVKTALSNVPIYVVVSEKFGRQIQAALAKAGHRDVVFVTQWQRNGPAGAVYNAIQYMEAKEHGGTTDTLVVFGENILWQPWHIQAVALNHCREEAELTLLTIPYVPGDERVEKIRHYSFLDYRHGYPSVVLSDPEGVHEGVRFLPSLYVFRNNRFVSNFHRLQTVQKETDGPGIPPEKHLPHMVGIAAAEYWRVRVLPDFVPEATLGFNTPAELEDVRRVFARQRSASPAVRPTFEMSLSEGKP